jgi:hypothetical protein
LIEKEGKHTGKKKRRRVEARTSEHSSFITSIERHRREEFETWKKSSKGRVNQKCGREETAVTERTKVKGRA